VTGDALYWYGSIWLFLFLTGVGLPPMPEEAGILYAAGLNALHPEVRWWGAWPAAGLGILMADSLLYGIGWKVGPRLFEYRWVQRVLSNERRLRLEGKIHQHGMKLLIMARFLPPLRTGVFLISGAARYSFTKFLIADLIYCVAGVGVFFFGGAWLLDMLKRVGHTAVWFVAVPLIGYGLYRYYRYLKKKEIGPASPVAAAAEPQATNPQGAVPAMREAKTMLKDG
jgi:membrane protein DedA with SNARE-associated domain